MLAWRVRTQLNCSSRSLKRQGFFWHGPKCVWRTFLFSIYWEYVTMHLRFYIGFLQHWSFCCISSFLHFLHGILLISQPKCVVSVNTVLKINFSWFSSKYGYTNLSCLSLSSKSYIWTFGTGINILMIFKFYFYNYVNISIKNAYDEQLVFLSCGFELNKISCSTTTILFSLPVSKA